MVFSFDLVQSQVQDGMLMRAGDHHNAIDIAKNQIAGVNADAPALDANIAVNHARAPFGVERADAAMEHREIHLSNLPHVTPHVLKHTFVSQALKVASPWIVSGMTATSIRTLAAVYGKHMVEDQKAAAEAMIKLARNSRAKTTGKKKATKLQKRAKRLPRKG